MSIQPRKLHNGRTVYDVRLRSEEGRQYKRTFRTKREAEAFEAEERVKQRSGGWVDPWAGRVLLEEYARAWLAGRPKLRPRTRELYDGQLNRHILPVLGETELAKLTTGQIRHWYGGLMTNNGLAPVTAAKCYRLLRTILGTAVEDGLVAKNPCVIKDAGVEHCEERPIATVGQVNALADAVTARWRAMVLLGTFTALRLGELLALERRHLDLQHLEVTVVAQAQELRSGERIVALPKTDAGRRVVSIPPHLHDELAHHLARWVEAAPTALLFCEEDGQPLRRYIWYRQWRRAVESLGLPELRFHDYPDLRVIPTCSCRACSAGVTKRRLSA